MERSNFIRIAGIALVANGVVTLSSCGTTPAAARVPTIYVVSYASAEATYSILEFAGNANTANGTYGATPNAAPIGSLTFPSGVGVSGIATDIGGQIYVTESIPPANTGSSYQTEIAIYPQGANGAATPIRTINLTNAAGSGNNVSGSIAVDASGNIYVGYDGQETLPTFNGVLEYGAAATGAATPIRNISGLGTKGRTFIADTMGTDAAGNLYVGCGLGVEVFSPTANGPATPIRTISGSNFGTGDFEQMAVDASGTVYIPSLSNNSQLAMLQVFGPGADGNAVPVGAITAPGGTYSVALDAAGNIYFAGLPPTYAGSAAAVPFLSAYGTLVSGMTRGSMFQPSGWTPPNVNLNFFVY